MGCEFGQWREWNHDASLDWDLLDAADAPGAAALGARSEPRVYQREPSLHQVDFDGAGFSWIDCNDNENSVDLVHPPCRADPRDFTVMVANFTPVPRPGYRVGVPEAGWYRELLNSDAAHLWRQRHGQRRRRDGRARAVARLRAVAPR